MLAASTYSCAAGSQNRTETYSRKQNGSIQAAVYSRRTDADTQLLVPLVCCSIDSLAILVGFTALEVIGSPLPFPSRLPFSENHGQ